MFNQKTHRQIVTAASEPAINKKIADMKKRGYVQISEVKVEHRVFTSLYTVVMKYVEKEVS